MKRSEIREIARQEAAAVLMKESTAITLDTERLSEDDEEAVREEMRQIAARLRGKDGAK